MYQGPRFTIVGLFQPSSHHGWQVLASGWHLMPQVQAKPECTGLDRDQMTFEIGNEIICKHTVVDVPVLLQNLNSIKLSE